MNLLLSCLASYLSHVKKIHAGKAWDAWNMSVRVFPAMVETHYKKPDEALFEIEASAR
jgi:hypothetical protein